MSLTLFFLVLLLGGDGESSSSLPQPLFGKDPGFLIGERLVYEGRVKMTGISVKAGRADFTVLEKTPGILTFQSRARGEGFGYSLETSITSRVRRTADAPHYFHYQQTGSESREKKLLFRNDGAVYMKVKHCRTKNCTRASHMVDAWNWAGPIPWGSKRVHCDERKCSKAAHHLWRQRGRHTYTEPCLDLLTAVYYARSIDFDEDGPWTVPIVNDRDRWLVNVKVRKRGRLEVQAGTFDAVQIVLEPSALEGEVKEEFKGLFGLNGAIEIWLDTRTRRPLRVRGKLPFAFMNLDADVELVEIHAPLAGEPAPAAFRKDGR